MTPDVSNTADLDFTRPADAGILLRTDGAKTEDRIVTRWRGSRGARHTPDAQWDRINGAEPAKAASMSPLLSRMRDVADVERAFPSAPDAPRIGNDQAYRRPAFSHDSVF